MARTKSKHSIYWYALLVLNVLPVLAVFAGITAWETAAYFYWGECALLGLFALSIYARYLIVFFILTIAIGLIVYLANSALMVDIIGILVFWSLYSLCWLVYIEVGRSAYGQIIKKLKPAAQLVIYIVFMGLSVGFCYATTNIVAGTHGLSGQSMTFYQTFFSVALIVPSITMGMLKVIDMVGQKHFLDFIFGTYHQPVERQRIVLFLDMVGSSAMAEKLEPKKSMDLIGRFIYDCSFIFRIHGGDILNYTGDGLVVLWPRNQPNSALSAVYKLRNHFSSKQVRHKYWKRFGVVPDFRIGLHAGQIVLNQIGEEKLFIGLYGDVVNTAARLEQMNKEVGTTVLLSADVTQGLNQSWKALLKPIGEKEVRGRDETIYVYGMYKDL